MSRENVDVVRRLYWAVSERDLRAVEELAHAEAEWSPDRRLGMDPIRGRDAVLAFFTDRAAMFGDLWVEPERFWDAGDRVLVFVRVSGAGEASGAGFDIHIAHLWTLREGAVVRGEGYGDRDEGLRAAGLA
jgi:ketosteroid isomerase-like protein